MKYKVYVSYSLTKRMEFLAEHETREAAMTEAAWQIDSSKILTRLQVVAPDGAIVFEV